MLLINGIPVVIGETKTPIRPSVSWLDGAHEIHDVYKNPVPQLFVPNILSFASEGKVLFYGSVRCPLEYWAPWRTEVDEDALAKRLGLGEMGKELLDFVLTKVRAVRAGGWEILNNAIHATPFPENGGPLRIGCWSFGPDNADEWVESEVNTFLGDSGGWLVLNLHGLDEEGWGPVSSVYLDKLLKRLVEVEFHDVLPVGMALENMDSE